MARHIYLTFGAVLLIMFSVGTAQEDFCWQHSFYNLGDLNADSMINILDLTYAVNYMFRGGPAPLPSVESADIDLNDRITLADVVWLIRGLFFDHGAKLKLVAQSPCCNVEWCNVSCPPGSCTTLVPLPGARVQAIKYDFGLVSEAVSDGSGSVFMLLPPGIFSLVVIPPSSKIDSTEDYFFISDSLVDLGERLYIERIAPHEVSVKYDTSLGLERLDEILTSVAATDYEQIGPSNWFGVSLPGCLHPQEAAVILSIFPEIMHVSVSYALCPLGNNK